MIDALLRDETEVSGPRPELTDQVIGRGSFGTVYLAKDQERDYAVKCCNPGKEGLPNLLEVALMSSVSHANLNRALAVEAHSDKLKIVQDLAVSDLARRRRGGDNKSLLYGIACAVGALHSLEIVHGDIKASNVLLYPDGSVRLSDFSLSLHKQSPGSVFTGSVCTPTHRPPECFLDEEWDESVDIWALGCTFFEVEYGYSLFPHQTAREFYEDVQGKNRRLIWCYLNALGEWMSSEHHQGKRRRLPKFAVSYNSLIFPSHFGESQLDKLIISLLQVTRSRPTISQVLSHEYFSGCSPPEPAVVAKHQRKGMTRHQRARFIRYLGRDTDITSSAVKDCAVRLYEILLAQNLPEERKTVLVCAWIASKLVLGVAPRCDYPLHHLLASEREVCDRLNYSLLCALY